jgi:hypothetical protein
MKFSVREKWSRIIGATILPYEGYSGWTLPGEAKRTAANPWIRTSGAFNGTIDFDAALRDPQTPRNEVSI